MDAELVALVSTVASALVGAMTADGWQVLRLRVARLLGRGNPRAEQVALETLDEDAASLTPDTERQLVAEWRGRLRDLLRADPTATDALRVMLPELTGGVSASGSAVAAGRDSHIQASSGGVAAGTIQGSVNIGSPTQPGSDRA